MMMKRISEFLVGLIFGFGLLLSGMTNPAKVIGFLDEYTVLVLTGGPASLVAGARVETVRRVDVVPVTPTATAPPRTPALAVTEVTLL